jgi:hypothetical protein
MLPARDVLGLISRLSSRVFMGEEFSADDSWNKAATEYTVTAFTNADKLRQWPRYLRPYVHWFMPEIQEVRAKLAAARQAIKPIMEKREALKAAAIARGESGVFDDSFYWFEQVYKDAYDPAVEQISLSLTAIHTTSDLLQATMFNIARHPELFQPLRDEIIRVLGAHGLTKQAMYDLRLMDSVIKESQRMKPIILGEP